MSTADEHRLPFFGAPPARLPLPVEDVPALRGKRVVLSTPEGFVYDVRAVSRVVRGDDGKAYVWVVSEYDWYRWAVTGEEPHFERYPARFVFVE